MEHDDSPYAALAPEAFWRSGVVDASPFNLQGLYQRKWEILPQDRIATAGSCFAQHIARFLRANRYRVLDLEPAPRELPEEQHGRFGYSMYSARYGNIYTAEQLLQLAREAAGEFTPADAVWEKDGRFYDALRPGVEPEGLDSAAQVRSHREFHLERVRALLCELDVLVFTLGLTEAWVHRESGTVYPTAPGTIAGRHVEQVHAFRNYEFGEIVRSLNEFRRLVRSMRKDAGDFRLLLTVSPVPLTATASGKHILQATTYSKSVLRAAAGQLANRQADVDYFPSYEIITNPGARGSFFENNLRSVRREGVEAVMRVFFAANAGVVAPTPQSADPAPEAFAQDPDEEQDVQCEEALLEAFAK